MGQRFDALDAMRGVAAIAVVLFHSRNWFPIPIAPGGYLAVDLFFLLSGFVIAHAYDSRLKNGLSTGGFLWLRLARLYPLLLIGTLLALLKGAGMMAVGEPNAPSAAELASYAILGLLFLPTPIIGGHMFLNSPAWSLMFEIIANIAYAAFFRLLSDRVLIGVVVGSFALLVVVAVKHNGVHAGFRWPELFEGAARVAFSFPLGVLLYRNRHRVSVLPAPPLMLYGLLAFALMLPINSAFYDLIFVAILSPAIVVLGANAASPRSAAYLGDISYPIYAIHHPLLAGVTLASSVTRIPGWIWCLTLVGTLLITCPLLVRFYDVPVRRWIVARGPRSDQMASLQAPASNHDDDK